MNSSQTLLKAIQDRQKLTKQSEKQRPITYPLNQYEKEFVQKVKKGKSEIDWIECIQKLRDEDKIVLDL